MKRAREKRKRGAQKNFYKGHEEIEKRVSL